MVEFCPDEIDKGAKRSELSFETEIESLRTRIKDTDTCITELKADFAAERAAYKEALKEGGTVLERFRSPMHCFCTQRKGKGQHSDRCTAAQEVILGLEAMDLDDEPEPEEKGEDE